MGSIIRLAGNIGAMNTIFISETADRFRNHKINRTSAGAKKSTNWVIIKDLSGLRELIPEGYQLTAIETANGAKNIFEYLFPTKVALIIGNETYGISDELLKMATQSVYIPVPGSVSSLNVTHALSIAAFEWLRQINNVSKSK